jgi:major vault protein
LDTKYDGVPTINVWTGYAVMVVDKKGGRRVEQGPTTILLDYDESLEVLELSTGKPKNTDKLERTVYLRTRNNKVSDIIDVETSDHVSVSVKISLLVNFDGEPDKWFEVENYVKLLCDHVRSVLKGVVKTHTIEEFYANHVPIIRDAILGHSVEGVRKGMPFKENGMIVQDVEVLGFTIADQNVANLLMSAQFAAVKANIDLQNARRNVSGKLEQEKLNQQVNVATADTRKQQLSTEQEILRKEMEVEAQNLEAIMKKVEGQQKQAQANEVVEDIRHNANMKRVVEKDGHDHDVEQKRLELTLRQLVAESESTISRFKAADGKMAEALLALNRDDVLTKAAKAISIQSLIGGESVVEVLTKVFNGTPLANIVNRLGAGIQSTESDTD